MRPEEKAARQVSAYECQSCNHDACDTCNPLKFTKRVIAREIAAHFLPILKRQCDGWKGTCGCHEVDDCSICDLGAEIAALEAAREGGN